MIIDFYPRPPRGGRLVEAGAAAGQRKFLSTPSARRATRHRERDQCDGSYFYPRPPRGGRPTSSGSFTTAPRFLSTPSARRATFAGVAPFGDCFLFLSTPSARRATLPPFHLCAAHIISIHALREEGDGIVPQQELGIAISIHALREEGDPPCARRLPSNRNFYPRPPRGGRRARDLERNSDMIFLSTPSARRATRCRCCR